MIPTSNNAPYQAMRAHLITVIDAWPGTDDHAAVIAARMYVDQTCATCGAIVDQLDICQACRMISYVRTTHPHQLRQMVINNAHDAAWQAAIAGVERALTALLQLQRLDYTSTRADEHHLPLLRTVSRLAEHTLTLCDGNSPVIVTAP